MKKTLLLLVIAALFAAGIISPAVSAAGTADGKDVPIGGYVILGEDGLDFTAFTNSGNYDVMVYVGEGADWQNRFSIQNPTSVDIDQNLKEGWYYPANSTEKNPNIMMGCYVASVSYYPTLHFEDISGKTVTSLKAVINEDLSFTLKGKPGVTYQIFKNDGYWDEKTLDRTSSPTWSLSITPTDMNPIIVDVYNKADNNDHSKLTISVGEKDDFRTIIFSMTSSDLLNGVFATGDEIRIYGAMEPSLASDGTTVYLYVTGVNLPASGVNLKGEPVVDNDPSTFTSTIFYAAANSWKFDWDTRGFEPGTYTIYASLEPLGYSDSRVMSGIETKSQNIYLSHPSIHVKFAEENDGLFTKGDYVYSYWSARGSPNKVRWYIIGPNFMETGLAENFPLYTDDQEPGKDAPQGLSGFTYNRFFSNNIAPGNYYLVYQHPGFNREFDVNPNNENGYFTSLTTNFGESASLDGRPSSNCAEALETLINNVRCDDLCVITDITIEPPYISIDQVEHLEIGEALKIKGTTNYAGEGVTADGTEVKNTFSLKVNRLDFDLAEENAAMQLQIVSRVVPQNIIPYYGERTYEFDEIDTSTWFEGTYQATVTNIDTGFEESIMFTVGGEGFEADSSTLNVPSDPLAEPYEELEPLPPIERYEEPTEPEEPKSPGFILAPLALGFAFILRRK